MIFNRLRALNLTSLPLTRSFHPARQLLMELLVSIVFVGCASKVATREGMDGDTGQPVIRVCLADALERTTLSFNGIFLLKLEEADYRLDETTGILNVFVKGDMLILKNEHRFFEITSPQTLTFQPEFPSSSFRWNDVTYSGELSIHFDSGKILVVNKLPLESYLQGVVPYEMPSLQNEYKEAVFAQAVASRSYALYYIYYPRDNLFDLRADRSDQVYHGIPENTPLAEKAVQNTKGIILTYQTQPALTPFHAASGGILEVTTYNDSLDSPGDAMAFDLVGGEYNDRVSPYYRWIESRKAGTILQNLGKEFGLDPPMIKDWMDRGFSMDIDILSRKSSGRVNALVIKAEDREFTVQENQIRRVFADEAGEPLPSTLFFLNISPTTPEKVYIIGAGAGHGRGMSQWGAIGMALKGYSYQKILKFYYPELNLIKFY